MIFLRNASTEKLQLITSSSATTDVQLNYVDVASTGSTSPVAAPQNTAITTATTTDICATPGSSTTRTVKQFTVRNKDATVSNDYTVVYDANGTDYELHKVTCLAGETLQYIEGVGFFTLKPAAGLDRVIVMASDSVHATAATFADVTGMTTPMLSGKKYSVEAHLFTVNSASTVGSQIGYNIGAIPTSALFGEMGAVTNSVTALALGGGTATARDTAIVAQTTGQTATGYHLIAGFIQPSADGTFALRATSEVTVAAGLTIKAGSWMAIRQER